MNNCWRAILLGSCHCGPTKDARSINEQEGRCYRWMKGKLATQTYVIKCLPCGVKDSFLVVVKTLQEQLLTIPGVRTMVVEPSSISVLYIRAYLYCIINNCKFEISLFDYFWLFPLFFQDFQRIFGQLFSLWNSVLKLFRFFTGHRWKFPSRGYIFGYLIISGYFGLVLALFFQDLQLIFGKLFRILLQLSIISISFCNSCMKDVSFLLRWKNSRN